MTAFGPYKQTEVIDFNNLEDNRLFVISGNTGAGKTTIFDGISFALYGTASGQDRENNAMLRSDFADEDTHTSVELEFELNSRRYRVLRQLGHVKKGNKSRTGDRYEFFEQTEGNETPCVDRQIVSEIDKKIEVLMGLTQDQFKQIVMLPQGEFRKLLTSQTENKEEILRRLFKTEPYKQISERLRVKKNVAEEGFNRAEQTRDQYIQNIHATLPVREESLVFQVLAEEHYNENQVIAGLEEEINHYENQIVLDHTHYKEAYIAHDKKQTDYHQSKAVNDRFVELNQKETRLKEQNEQIPLYDRKEKQLDAAERASNLLPYQKQVEEWRQEEDRKTRTLDEAIRVKKEVDNTVEKVQSIFELEEQKQTKRENVRKGLDRLQEFLPVVKEIDEKKQHIEILSREQKHKDDELKKVQAEIKDKSVKAEEYNKKIKTIDQAVGQLPDKQQQLNEMREKARVVIKYIDLRDKQTALKKDLILKQTAYEQMKSTYSEMERAWLNNQASILASHLHNGEACPVCGSKTHPEKATTEDGVVTKEQLEASKKKLDDKDVDYREATASLNSNKELLTEKAKEVTDYSIQVSDAEAVRDRLVEEGKQLKEEVDKLEGMRGKLTDLKEAYEKTNETSKQLGEKAEKDRQSYQQVKTDYDKAMAVYHERIQHIPEEVRVLSVLEEKIKDMEKERIQLEKSWEDAQTRLQKAKEDQTKITANLSHANKQLEEAEEKRKKAEHQFMEAISKAAFDSEQAYHEAKMQEDERQKLKKDIEQFKQNRSTLNEQVNELKVTLKDKTQVDLPALQDQMEQLKQAYEAALQTWNQSKEYHQEAIELKANIIDATNRVRKNEKQLGTIVDLYDAIRGQNSQKVSFERYLQIEYLEQIIEAANHRLKRLSNGQFFLIRSDRQESHGRQSGLALDVYDAYTGRMRDVKTMSGGEKFNASLCLALGMSDVIQSFQGNISIETMFIDEGFGTLDEEALNKAIDTLVDLQQSGRMIGVISHVQELKTIFPAVLEVSKTKEGSSHTRFLLK